MKNSEETKRILASALKELMKEKEVEKISIREISELAGVNRQTFYYHFEDIYDLLKWTFQQEAVQQLATRESTEVWQEGLLQLFYYLEENRDICLCALRSLGRDHMKRFFYADIYQVIGRVVTEFGEKCKSPTEYMAFLTHFFTLSLASLIESWLLGEMDQTPKELIEMIDVFIQDQLHGAALRIQGQGT